MWGKKCYKGYKHHMRVLKKAFWDLKPLCNGQILMKHKKNCQGKLDIPKMSKDTKGNLNATWGLLSWPRKTVRTGLDGETYILVADYYSKFPLCTSHEVIEVLESILREYGTWLETTVYNMTVALSSHFSKHGTSNMSLPRQHKCKCIHRKNGANHQKYHKGGKRQDRNEHGFVIPDNIPHRPQAAVSYWAAVLKSNKG